jgi:predicted transcriptional regulator
MVNLTVPIDDDTRLALRHLAIAERTTMSALVSEAIELLFAMRSSGGVVRDKGVGK